MGLKGRDWSLAVATAIRGLLSSRIAWVALLSGLLWVAARRAQEGLAKDPRFLAMPMGLDARGPSWGSDEVLKPVRERLERLGPMNLFDPRFEEKIRGALGEVPGIAAVHDVRRHWPNRYSVSFRLYRPVAVVVWKDRVVPVTGKGVALPHEPYARASEGLLTITGVAEPPPKAGEPWRSEALLDGLATLCQIAPHLDRLRPLLLDTIDVAAAGKPRKGVVLHGEALVDVLWGRPRAPVGENPVTKKASLLEIAASSAAALRGQTVDVRFNTILLRQSPP
ncbi:MAG: hypothetical protein ACHQ1G_07920 [Planctomycetota bacterium]